MDLSMTTIEMVSLIETKFKTITFSYRLAIYKTQAFHLLICFSYKPTHTYRFYPFRCYYRNPNYVRRQRFSC